MQSINKFKGLILAGLLIALVVVGSFVQIGQAAPPAAPTPVAAPDASGVGVAFSSQEATALIADTNTGAVDLLKYKTLDVEYVIDQATATNTVTINLQYSINGSTWTDGVAVVSANAADASGLAVRLPVFGRFIRLNQDVTNSNPVTITLSGVAR